MTPDHEVTMTSHDDIITRQSLVGQTWADLGGSAAKPREVQKGAMPPIMEAAQNNVFGAESFRGRQDGSVQSRR